MFSRHLIDGGDINFLEPIYICDDKILEKDGLKILVNPKNVFILAYVHCLPSMIYLIGALIELYGIDPSQIIVLCKPYSRIDGAIKKLKMARVRVLDSSFKFQPGRYDEEAWKGISNACDFVYKLSKKSIGKSNRPRVILVDDGGLLTEHWYRKFRDQEIEVVSVQQTASGVGRSPIESRILKINVARSAAKKWFESRIIAAGVLNKIESMMEIGSSGPIGVVGTGAIGNALVNLLNEKQFDVLTYDRVSCNTNINRRNVRIAAKVDELIREARIIYGCTGHNWLRADKLRGKNAIKMISCSSRDIEFKEVLQVFAKRWEGEWTDGEQYGPITLEGGAERIVLNGGFPINFDREIEWERRQEIVLTRALVLLGIVQAMSVKVGRVARGAMKLAPHAQMAIVHKWLVEVEEMSRGKNRSDILYEFGVESSEIERGGWFEENSSGYAF
jgi:hypothetical protein